MAWALSVRIYIVGRSERIVVVNRAGSLNLLVAWCREAVGGACRMGLQAFAKREFSSNFAQCLRTGLRDVDQT